VSTEIPVGSVVRDLATDRVGVLMAMGDYLDTYHRDRPAVHLAFLRPVGGGREWTTRLEQVALEPRLSP
jgi:hypothetical protein